MRDELRGEVAVVTGGGRGFGRAIARRLASGGARVAIVSRSGDELDAAAACIRASGGGALPIEGDVTSRADVELVKEEVERALGPPSILVHGAGVLRPFGPVWGVDPDEWWEAHAVHLRGALLFARAFVPGMVQGGGGRVIVLSSSASERVEPCLSAYNVAKSAQNRLVAHLAAEGRTHGVFAWAVDPGFAITRLSEEAIASASARRHVPELVSRFEQKRREDDPSEVLSRCADFCAELAAGHADELSGCYLAAGDPQPRSYRRRLRIVKSALLKAVRG